MKLKNKKSEKVFTPKENESGEPEQWFCPETGKVKLRLNGKGPHGSILSDEDYEELRRLEKLIPGGKTVFDRGEALRTIKVRGLYRHYGDGVLDFDVCVRNYWGISEKYAYRLIAAYCVYDDLKDMEAVVMPKNEAQVRHLAPFGKDERRLLWSRIVERAKGRRITEKIAKRVVEEFTKQCGTSIPQIAKRRIKLNLEAMCRLQRYTGYTMRAIEREDPQAALELLNKMAAQLYGTEGPLVEPDYEI